MKARTSFEKSVVAANERLTDIAQKQIDWAVSKCIDHVAFRTAHGKCVCGDCGHSFIYEGKAKTIRCPHCGKSLTINDTKRRNLEYKTYFGVLEIKNGIQVLRVHLLEEKYRKGQEPKSFAVEVCRLWVSNKGQVAATSLKRCLGWYVDSFNWASKIELRQLSDVLMHISDCYIYPHYRLLPELRRNGLKSIATDVHPVSLMKGLLTDSRIETLQKRGDHNALKHFIRNGSDLARCWDSYKIAMRRSYLPEDMMMWCDLIKLLDKCGRDIHSPKYVCPTDLKAEHDHWLNKVRKAEQKKRDEIQLKKAKEDEANFYATKSCYFGIVIADTDIEISVLDTIEAYKDEGEHMRHCVFRASYYTKPESIILSAHDREGNRIETIEFSLTEGRVIQSRGVCNSNTDYHDRIVNLVNSNAYRFLEAKATA